MATEDVKKFPDILPLDERPKLYRTLALNKRRTPMYVMGWTFDREDMKRFDPSYQDLNLSTFTHMILVADWYQKGFMERFGIDYMYKEGFIDAAREVLAYPEHEPIWCRLGN